MPLRISSGRLRMKSPGPGWLRAGALLVFLGAAWPAQAQQASEEVITRYEQILERAPVEGPSFDKLLQIYQQGDGLEKLDARWEPLSAQPGAKGATYLLLRGLLADRMGKTDAAKKFLQAAAQAQPDDYHAWTALGDFEVRQGRWTDAIAALQKGLATPVTGDDRLALYRKLGQAQERNLDLPAALVTWQKMVDEFPKNAFALEEAGNAELDAGQFDEARKTFQKLVDLTDPNSMNRVQALMHLAEVDDRQGRTDAAVHGYEAILPLTAESSWLNRELRAQIEQIYRRQDDLAGLVGYYQKWTQDNPKDVDALLLLSGALTELGKKPEALEVLRKVVALAPDRHEVRENFAQALVEAKQYDEAITVETALTADDPTEPRYWQTLGEALWLKTQPPTPESKKAVLDAWNHIAPPGSKDIAAVITVADLCRDHGFNDEALAGYQRALALSPDASDVREKEVKLLIDLKRQDDAWKLLDAMVDGSLATPANYLKLAALDRQFDRMDAAADVVRKGLALDPKNFDLLTMQWNQLAEDQKWSDCVALFGQLVAAAPNAYFVDQLEVRHLRALTSAGMLDDTAKRLRAQIGADPGMSEGDLRMLLRIFIQQSDPDVSKALDEAHRRFPQSISLIRIEIDYDRHSGNYDGAVAALQKLIEAAPQQKTDWLQELVHVRQDQGNVDEALKAAQQIIDTSPAGADGYLLYAEVAFAAQKPDAAVEKLQAAIKLSDKPNDVRQRLARYYLEAGQPAKARAVYDDAFTAADNPQDKLAIVRAMTPAYFQDGQIDDLINRFKKEQGSEEGGWRYGLYLSAIYEQMQDFGAARQELAKSLAVRPKDANLLRSLISLSDKENDRAAVLRYREMLADADPGPANAIALANEYAAQDKPEDAWRIVQKNLADVIKDPLAWKDVLNQMTDPTYAAKIKGVLEEAIRAKGDSFEGKFVLAQFQLQQGDIDGARKTLWDILAQPIPPPSPVPATSGSAPGKSAAAGSVYSLYQSPMMQRGMQSMIAMNEVQQLVSASQSRGRTQGRMRGIGQVYSSQGISTALTPEAIHDRALMYLAFLAVQQQQAEPFLKELAAKFDEWHWPLADRIEAYAMIQAREPLLQALEEQAKGVPDKELDQFCYLACEDYISNQNVDDAMRKRAEAVQEVFAARVEQDPQLRNLTTMMTINHLSGDTTPEGATKRKAAVDEYVKTIDRKDPDQLAEVISLCAQADDWVELKKAADDLAAIDPSRWSVTTAQQLGYLPMAVLQQAAVTKEVMPKETIPVLLELMKLGYPATPPRPAMAATSSFGFGGVVINGYFYNQNMFPPANRYLAPQQVGIMEPMFQQLKAREILPAMYAALDQEEKDFTDWRKIYPRLMRIYFQWWDGKRADAIASVRKLLEEDPSDDWRLLLASMLTLDQKYDQAIPVLNSVSARYGPDYIRAQKQLLRVAALAKNNDVGQKAGQNLLALHLPRQEQMTIVNDLRLVGLSAKADEILKNQSSTGGQAVANTQANSRVLSTMNQALNQHDMTRASDLARQILKRDPSASLRNGSDDFMRSQTFVGQAIVALKKAGQLDAYIQDLEKQLDADPSSVRLNWLVAEAYLHKNDIHENADNDEADLRKSADYFKKVAELDPRDELALAPVADRFFHNNHPDTAADLYAIILKADFTGGMMQYYNVLNTFTQANRLPDLIKIINDWTPPPLNPSFGGGQDMYFVLVQLGNNLRQSGHLPEAEQVLRKALSVESYQSKQDGVTGLVEVLVDEDRRDEARAEIEKSLLDKKAPSSAVPLLLGFNARVVVQSAWFQSIGWTGNGVVVAPIIRFLELANSLGMAPKLQKELADMAGKNPVAPGGNIDQYRLAEVLLAIIARDPGYKPDLEKLMKDYPPSARLNTGAFSPYLIISQELAKWPEQRPAALRLAQQVAECQGTGLNNVFQNMANLQIIRIARDMGDHKILQESLRRSAATMRQQRMVNPSQVPIDQELDVARAMVQEGMLKEAEEALADAKTDPQLTQTPNGNSYHQQKIGEVENQIAFAKGEKSTVGLVYGLTSKSKKGGPEIFWQINPAGKTSDKMTYFSRTPWIDGGKARPTSYSIDISGGPDGDHLAHLASLSSVATRGSAPLKIPPGVAAIQASLVQSKPDATAPVGTVAVGQVLLLGAPENLLANPEFKTTKDSAGQEQVSGWRGLGADGVSRKAGGPLGSYLTLEARLGVGGAADVVCDPITMKPNTNYVLEGWMRLSGNIAVRYLDSSGKVLNPAQTVGGANDADWQWRAWVICGDSRSTISGQVVPPAAAAFQIFLRFNQDSDVAGLRVHAWPAVPAP